jgi:hypothetical protein
MSVLKQTMNWYNLDMSDSSCVLLVYSIQNKGKHDDVFEGKFNVNYFWNTAITLVFVVVFLNIKL